MADIIVPKRNEMETREGDQFTIRFIKFAEELTAQVNENTEGTGDLFGRELVEQLLMIFGGQKLEPRIKQNAGRITNMGKDVSTIANELAGLRAQVHRQKGMIRNMDNVLESILDTDILATTRAQLIRMQEQTSNAEENSGYGITRLHG